MTSPIGSLRAELSANAAQFELDMRAARNSVQKHSGGMRKAFKSLGSQTKATVGQFLNFKAGIAGLIGVGAGGGLTMLMNRAIESTGTIKDMASMAGIGAEALQEMQYAMGRFGVTNDALVDGLKELNLRADEFAKTGKGSAAEAFERLGLQQAEVNALLGDADQLFKVVHGRMQDLGTAARIRIADEIFGGQGGEQFVQALARSGDEMARLRQEARDMGLVFSNEMVEGADQAADQVKLLSQVLNAQLNQALVALAPAITTVTKGLTDAAVAVGNFFRSIDNAYADDLENDIAALDKEIAHYQKLLERRAGINEERDTNLRIRIAELAEERALLELRVMRLRGELDDLHNQATAEAGKSKSAPTMNGNVVPVPGEKDHDKALRHRQREYDKLMESVEAARQATVEWGAVTEAQRKALQEMADQEMAELKDLAGEIGDSFASAFERSIMSGEKFSDVLKALARDLLQLTLRKAVSDSIGNAIGSVIGDVFAGMFKADGGPVTGNRPYVVGERGPELFVPRTSGQIVPNHGLKAGGGLTIYADMRGASLEAVNELRGMVAQLHGTLESRAVAANVASRARNMRRG